MTRCFAVLLAAGIAGLIGCSKSTETADQNAASAPNASGSLNGEQGPAPQDIVSQFLDRVRRGGEGASAGELLTVKAQQELERIGRSVMPIGSPDAKFAVTRSESVPGESGSVLVHSVWSEPLPTGELLETQVVWAVEQDPVQWRISGLAMEMEAGQDPQIIDFENGELMAQLLNETESDVAEQATAVQAASQTPTNR